MASERPVALDERFALDQTQRALPYHFAQS